MACGAQVYRVAEFQSTPSLRKATAAALFQAAAEAVSIHAFLEEGDDLRGDAWLFGTPFQSTPSLRKATSSQCASMLLWNVSIHAFLEEGDAAIALLVDDEERFNPRLP